MEVLYVPWVVQWFSILCGQVNTSRVAYLGHTKGALSAEGEIVSSFLSKHLSQHQIIHLELSAAHEPLLVAFE
jgi:thiazole synthase ThiGH ThiG subunit